jgi:N-formylglutamate deformylase
MNDQFPPWVVFHLPHDSMVVPSQVRRQITLIDDELAQVLVNMTVHWTLSLFASDEPEAQVVRVPVSRLVVDDEPFKQDEHEPMAEIGMGAIYTATFSLMPVRLDVHPDERESLMQTYYRPHHTTPRFGSKQRWRRLQPTHGICAAMACSGRQGSKGVRAAGCAGK